MEINTSEGLPSHSEVSNTRGMSKVVSETAAKLALQSAEGNLNTRTGRRLKRFSEQLAKKLAQNEFRREKMMGSTHSLDEKEVDPRKRLEDLWELKDKDYKIDIKREVKANIRETEIVIEEIKDKKIKKDPFGSEIIKMETLPPTPMPPPENAIELLDWNQLMVEIRDLCFSFSRNKKFMNNLNMSVPKSAIYGLLGPSGCGKTTLLKLILGLMRAKSGLIKVNGKRPGDPNNNIPGTGVGFMPQELALYQEFTLSEALRYYSRIYGMTDEQIVSRTKFLVDFLDLPDPDRLIDKMSGGQKRRVSLALSLVHNPPLLVLDEPTVGTDPVLRERIWEHLVILSKKESTTIIITTHYIEEARRAHVVSLMREGQLLVEHSPQYLLKHLNAQNLEEVFLKLCRDNPNRAEQMPRNYYDTKSMQTTDKNIGNGNTDKTNNLNKKPVHSEVRTKHVSSHSRIYNQTHKNYIRLIRNKPLLIFETVLPTICVIIFFLCIGNKPHGLKIAVYNEEYEEKHLANNNLVILSDEFLKSVPNRTIFFKHFDSNQSAIDSVIENSEIYGALIFPKEFTVSLGRRLFAGHKATDGDVENSTILFFADFTDMIITETLTRALIKAQYKFEQTVIEKYMVFLDQSSNTTVKRHTRALDPIVKFVDPPIYGSINPEFRDFITPGIILTVIFVMAMGLTALSLVIERKEGTMERTLVAGIKQHEILLSQVILQFFIVILQTALMLIFTFIVFRMQNKGNFGLIILIILLQGLTGMCYGLMISAICSDENSAIMASLGSFYPYFLLSGIIWPLEGMPYGIRIFSYLLPQTLPIISLRNIMLKGWYVSHLFVYLGFVSTIVWMFIFLSIAALILKFRDNPYFHHIFNK